MLLTELRRSFLLLAVAAGLAASAVAQGSVSINGVAMRSASIAGNGASVHYLIGGAGPPLLLLHGFTGIGADWAPFLPELTAAFTVVAPDLRGHGRSTNPAAAFDHREAARDVGALLDELRWRRVSAIGYSSGANVLLHMALQRPELLGGAVLVNGAHRIDPHAHEILSAYPQFDALSAQERTTYLARHPGGEAQVRQILAQLRAVGVVREHVELTPAQISSIRVPALIVAGDRDELYPLSVTTELFRLLPVARIWVIPGQGHNALWAAWGGSPWAIREFPTVVKEFFNSAR